MVGIQELFDEFVRCTRRVSALFWAEITDPF